MLKKIVMAAALTGLILMMAPTAFAQYTFFSVVRQTEAQPGTVWHRYYTPGQDPVNAAAPDICATDGFEEYGPNQWYCATGHTNKPDKDKVGYVGTLNDLFNFNGDDCGSLYHAVWDTEIDAGLTTHAGYYAWMAGNVNCDEQADNWADSCAGTQRAAKCFGSADIDNAAGSAVANAPGGGLDPRGGLRPIPVPLPDNVDSATGDISLSWNEASTIGDHAESAQYDLYYVVRDGACDAPTADEFTFLRTEAGTSTVVNTTTDLGFDPTEQKGVFFAIKLRYPNSAAYEVVSRYLSGNSQCIAFGGFAADVVDIKASWMGGNRVAVSWRTELEDGALGFYVTRALNPNGPFERVSNMIPANGEPSSYSHVDQINPRALNMSGASGLFYKIETIDSKNDSKFSEAVQADLPAVPGDIRIKKDLRDNPRRSIR